MKRVVDWNEEMESQHRLDVQKGSPLFELLAWRRGSSTAHTTEHFSRNSNALGHRNSQKEDQQLLHTFSPSTNFTTSNPIELRINEDNQPSSNKEAITPSFPLSFDIETDSHTSQSSTIITRRSSKPSRHEVLPPITSQTRQHQRDRYANYRHRLRETKLYSLVVSSNGVQCFGTNCQPSVFNASLRCRTISSEKDLDSIKMSPLMNDQAVKQNMSYISLTNISNLLDHEPNVSRRESYSRSTSNILMHKPSLFLAEIFNKMTHEERAQSIAQLVHFHENLTKSDTTMEKLQRTTSLPNFDNKLTKLHSVTSLLSERTIADLNQVETKASSIQEKPLSEDIISEHVNPKISRSAGTADLPVHMSKNLSKPSDDQTPSKFVSSPERKISHENLHSNAPSMSISTVPSLIAHSSKPSPIFIKLSKSNSSIHSGRIRKNRSNNSFDVHSDKQTSRSQLQHSETSMIKRNKTQSLNLSNSIEEKAIISSSNPTTIRKQSADNNIESKKNSDNRNISQLLKISPSSKTVSTHTSQSKLLAPAVTNQETYMSSTSPHFHSLNGGNEIEFSLNDVTSHLSQQDMIISNTDLDKLVDIPPKDLNTPNQALPTVQAVEEISQHSIPSHSYLINPTSFITTDKTLPISSTKPELAPVSPTDDDDDDDDDDSSLTTRITTPSTDLIAVNDDDDQPLLVNEQLKRSSLSLTHDSLELLHDTTPYRARNEEQSTPLTNTESTPHKRKSVLKSHLSSLDSLPTPDLISYVAVDKVKGDKRLLEKHMQYDFRTVLNVTSVLYRRRSLTIGGGTIVACISPKPKRDSLTLLEERQSGSTTPHSGYYHLSGSESKHVEFIRKPGEITTPVLHIRRGIKSKYPSNKPSSPSSSRDHFFSRTFDVSEQTKSDISVIDSQRPFEAETPPRRSSSDSMSRHRTSQSLLTSADDLEQEKICFTKNDYNQMIRLMMTPLSENKGNHLVQPTFGSKIELCINHRLTTLQNLILVILLISFYLFVFIKSQYWQEHNHR